jgi:hypothetical protein
VGARDSPADPSWQYDVFISYSHEDRAWAERLTGDLRAKQLTVFLDDDRLTAGIQWRPQLIQTLKESRHLVVLSSSAARRSEWVQKESNRFEAIVDPNGEGGTGDRGIFVVLLEGESPGFAHLQTIRDLLAVDAYGLGAEDAPVAEWNRVVKRVADAIQSSEQATLIPILLVTTTMERAGGIDLDADLPDAPPLRQFLATLGIAEPQFMASYGATRRDWRPFGSQESIETILDRLGDELNDELRDAGSGLVRWDYVSEDFWSDEHYAEQQTRRLKRRPAVVVIDPLSFYDGLVRTRYSNYIDEVFNNSKAFVLVLSPFSPAPSEIVLRDAIKRMARKVFSHFYAPPAFEGRAYARSGPSVGDPEEFRGWLAAALATHFSAATPEPVSYVRMAGS